jgi:hypothetical protein
MIVHVIGNSHVGYFVGRAAETDSVLEYSEDDLLIRAYKAGQTGATVIGLDNPESETGAGWKFKNYVEQNVPVENLVVVLGDVDARYHVGNSRCTYSYMNSVCRKLVEYIDGLSLPHLRRLILFGMVPYTYNAMIDLSQDRKEYAQVALNFMSRELKLVCGSRHARGWRYLSVYRDMVGDDGFLDQEFREQYDYSHCNYTKTKKLILPKLRDLLK